MDKNFAVAGSDRILKIVFFFQDFNNYTPERETSQSSRNEIVTTRFDPSSMKPILYTEMEATKPLRSTLRSRNLTGEIFGSVLSESAAIRSFEERRA